MVRHYDDDIPAEFKGQMQPRQSHGFPTECISNVIWADLEVIDTWCGVKHGVAKST